MAIGEKGSSRGVSKMLKMAIDSMGEMWMLKMVQDGLKGNG